MGTDSPEIQIIQMILGFNSSYLLGWGGGTCNDFSDLLEPAHGRVVVGRT